MSVHNFKRKCNLTTLTITSGSSGYYGGCFVYSLAQLPGYTEFTNLYDQFQITYVKTHIVCRFTGIPFSSYSTTGMGMPEIIYVTDRDDNTAPSADAAGMNTIRQYNSARGFLFTPEKRDCEIKFKPNVLSNQYESAIATAYAPKFGQWLSTDDSATPHYGTKFVIRCPCVGTMPDNVEFDVFCTYWLRMKGAK